MKIAFFNTTETDKQFFSPALKGHAVELIPEPINDDFLPFTHDLEAISVFVNSQVTQKVIDLLPKLRFIATRSTGFDHIDLAACKKRAIAVSNVPSYGSNTVAEFTFALILELSRKVSGSYNQIRQTGSFSVAQWQGFDLSGKTVGVVGTGKIGANVVQIAHGFDMQIHCYDPFPNEQLKTQYDATYMTLEQVLETSDIVSLHVPYIPNKTHHIMHKKAFDRMKPGTYFINTARGELVDTEALVEALQSGHLAGAGLDVLEEESFTQHCEERLLEIHPNEQQLKEYLFNHYLIDADNVIITPHNAFNTVEAIQRIRQTTLENIIAFISGKPQNVVSL
ncbi:MAG: D-isomer specific 2-hydroxyacid dehydrogenase NAD-binding protein [Parcubacteria group bacterium GW2011_GWA2_47_8]|nr:MAG: D-isomer specific 2-hydroxyacid dehydrogenase NAD-binding protein [Parcubacteria group bacterium GW2011_GWA2_47_8]